MVNTDNDNSAVETKLSTTVTNAKHGNDNPQKKDKERFKERGTERSGLITSESNMGDKHNAHEKVVCSKDATLENENNKQPQNRQKREKKFLLTTVLGVNTHAKKR